MKLSCLEIFTLELSIRNEKILKIAGIYVLLIYATASDNLICATTTCSQTLQREIQVSHWQQPKIIVLVKNHQQKLKLVDESLMNHGGADKFRKKITMLLHDWLASQTLDTVYHHNNQIICTYMKQNTLLLHL